MTLDYFHPSSIHSTYHSSRTISPDSSTLSQYTQQILKLNESACSVQYEGFRAAQLKMNLISQKEFLTIVYQYQMCLLNFKGKYMRPLIRDFEYSIPFSNEIAKEFIKINAEFEEKYWKGYSDLVKGIIQEYKENMPELQKYNASSNELKESNEKNTRATFDDSIKKYNPNFCNAKLSKFADCLRKSAHGDSCQPLLMNYQFCKQISAVIENGSLESCISDTFIKWFRIQNPNTNISDGQLLQYKNKFSDSIDLIQANCVDVFKFGFEEELTTEHLIKGRQTFLEIEKDFEI